LTALQQTFDAKQHGTINRQRQSWALLVQYEIHSNSKKERPTANYVIVCVGTFALDYLQKQ
jgi:hypothetical protein